jgi:hypothetical protein
LPFSGIGSPATSSGLTSSTTTLTGAQLLSSVTLRTSPTFTLTGTPRVYDGSTAPNITAVSAYYPSQDGANIDFTSSGLIAGRPGIVLANTTNSVTYDLSAEL